VRDKSVHPPTSSHPPVRTWTIQIFTCLYFVGGTEYGSRGMSPHFTGYLLGGRRPHAYIGLFNPIKHTGSFSVKFSVYWLISNPYFFFWILYTVCMIPLSRSFIVFFKKLTYSNLQYLLSLSPENFSIQTHTHTHPNKTFCQSVCLSVCNL